MAELAHNGRDYRGAAKTMKFTQKQLNDIESCLYFLPENLRKFEVTDQDRREFLDASEKGIISPRMNRHGQVNNGLDMILQGKEWRGVHCDSSKTHRSMYEEGILDGSMPYITILGGYELNKKPIWFWNILGRFGFETMKHNPIPFYVKDYMKKSLFQGMDAEVIERCYQEITK